MGVFIENHIDKTVVIQPVKGLVGFPCARHFYNLTLSFQKSLDLSCAPLFATQEVKGFFILHVQPDLELPHPFPRPLLLTPPPGRCPS